MLKWSEGVQRRGLGENGGGCDDFSSSLNELEASAGF